MTAPYLVVGAGPTGLGCAAELATAHPVELIDRIPVPGGEAGWSTPEITALVEAARRSGVRFRLGNTAVRWEPGRLLVAGPGRIEWLPANICSTQAAFGRPRPLTCSSQATGQPVSFRPPSPNTC